MDALISIMNGTLIKNIMNCLREDDSSLFCFGGIVMSIILCFVIFLVSYGTYNMLCYLFMLPTAVAGNAVSLVGRGKKQSFLDQGSVIIVENVVNRWELYWNDEVRLEKYLREKEIYTRGTTYLVSKCIKFIGGALIFLPVAFMHRTLFLLLILFWVFCCGWDITRTIFSLKKVNFLKFLIIEKFVVSIFPWIYGIFNIYLIVKLFT